MLMMTLGVREARPPCLCYTTAVPSTDIRQKPGKLDQVPQILHQLYCAQPSRSLENESQLGEIGTKLLIDRGVTVQFLTSPGSAPDNAPEPSSGILVQSNRTSLFK